MMMVFSAQLAEGGGAPQLLSLYLPSQLELRGHLHTFPNKTSERMLNVLSNVATIPQHLGSTSVSSGTVGTDGRQMKQG